MIHMKPYIVTLQPFLLNVGRYEKSWYQRKEKRLQRRLEHQYRLWTPGLTFCFVAKAICLDLSRVLAGPGFPIPPNLDQIPPKCSDVTIIQNNHPHHQHPHRLDQIFMKFIIIVISFVIIMTISAHFDCIVINSWCAVNQKLIRSIDIGRNWLKGGRGTCIYSIYCNDFDQNPHASATNWLSWDKYIKVNWLEFSRIYCK